ncbi:MAG: SH3 domain-containing protein [Oscillospiraceae bacterium]|nr:SH3 domain-containing protein [Oscillospiraceae bacterium]MBQ9959758.1 SH3 domain-containing protein [Oscillospiraceae bacterium]
MPGYNYAAIIKKAKLSSPGDRVRVKATALSVRSGAGTKYTAVKQLPKGTVCCIVQERANGGTRWGKLADGAGWISLKYTEQI